MELITADLQPTDSPPFFRLTGRSSDTQTGECAEGDGWASNWRACVHRSEGLPVPLPSPRDKLFFASMKDMLKVHLPLRQMINLHRYALLNSVFPSHKVVCIFRSNFALILLSEMVMDPGDVDWAAHLPLLLHVVTLGKTVPHAPILLWAVCTSIPSLARSGHP